MAHDLTPTDLLHPAGDLPLTLFPDKSPGKTAEDALLLWLDDAQTKLDNVPEGSQNDAARHYVYAKAYRAFASWLATQPNSITDGGGPMSTQRQIGADRVNHWELKANAETAAYNALLVMPATDQSLIPPSGRVRVRAAW